MSSAPRRAYALTLVACLAGAALALYAATRTWALHVTPRAGLSPLRVAQTGADVEPWVMGLAVVALAGSGALLATRGVVRRVLGGLLTIAGLGVLVGAVVGRAGLDVGEAGAGTFWAVCCAFGGAVIAVGGLLTVRRGHRWPVMSSRYERPRRAERGGERRSGLEGGDHRAAWEALDRGDDPTV